MRNSLRRLDSATNLIKALLIATAGSIAATKSVSAQTISGFSAEKHAVATVTGVIQPILSTRPVGSPVRLEDGRFEQRYVIAANVAFRLVNASGASKDVQCAEGTREVSIAEFEGSAGYHAELRVRGTDESALGITAEARVNTQR